MKVRNAGSAAARNVQMKLRSGNPEPNDSRWLGDYPYPVYRAGIITNDPGQISALGSLINANDDESYEIVCGWKAESGSFWTNLNTKGGGHNQIHIDTDERWRLSYEVTAENALPVRFDLDIFVEGDEVKVSRIVHLTSAARL
jgi:hypothetical protein